MTMQVHHGNNQHFTIFHSVNYPVRKTMRAAAADFRIKRLPRFRPLNDAGNGGADFPEKIMTKSGNLLFVVTRR
jgi:hypothetical protein